MHCTLGGNHSEEVFLNGPSLASLRGFFHFKAFFVNYYITHNFVNQENISAPMRLTSLLGTSQQQEGVLDKCHCCSLAILNKSGRLPSKICQQDAQVKA